MAVLFAVALLVVAGVMRQHSIGHTPSLDVYRDELCPFLILAGHKSPGNGNELALDAVLFTVDRNWMHFWFGISPRHGRARLSPLPLPPW